MKTIQPHLKHITTLLCETYSTSEYFGYKLTFSILKSTVFHDTFWT